MNTSSVDTPCTRCVACDNGERVAARRSRLADRENRTALVVGVPVEECSACGRVWLSIDVAKRLDGLFNTLLSSGAELAQTTWESSLVR